MVNIVSFMCTQLCTVLYSYNGRHLGKTINSAIYIQYTCYKSFANTYNISHLQRLIIYLKEKQEVNKLLLCNVYINGNICSFKFPLNIFKLEACLIFNGS